MTVTCAWCGRRADDVDALSWATSTVGDQVERCCDTCTRRHLRAMEAKLDPEFW